MGKKKITPQAAPIGKLNETRTQRRTRWVNPFAGFWRRLYDFFHRKECYIVVDPRDNSVTMSRGLCRKVKVDDLTNDKVWVGRNSRGGYVIQFNCTLDEEQTQVAHLQYNSKYKSYGFETLTPSVNLMYYKWGLQDAAPRKLSVWESMMPDVWEIDTPH